MIITGAAVHYKIYRDDQYPKLITVNTGEANPPDKDQRIFISTPEAHLTLRPGEARLLMELLAKVLT